MDSKTVEILKPKINSDRIKFLFSSYGIDLLTNICPSVFPHIRFSNLYSYSQLPLESPSSYKESGYDKSKIMRTLALVDFKPVNPLLVNAHKKIQEGSSIGETLKEAGFIINKKAIYFGEINLPPIFMEMMGEKKQQNAALYIYELGVKNLENLAGAESIPYCTIIEIYSPQYLTLDWLKALYPSDYINNHQGNASIEKLLDDLRQCLSLSFRILK